MNNKTQIVDEIIRINAPITELQNRLKKLERYKTTLENAEIFANKLSFSMYKLEIFLA
jgi:predicted nuclease with TOPRIM domain